MHSVRRDDDREFDSPTSGQVVAQAARSVQLLNAIEGAVTRCHSNAEILRTIAAEFEKATVGLGKSAGTALLDPEGRANKLLRQASAAAARIHEDAAAGMHSADNDRDLFQEDGVAEAFSTLADAASDVHDVLETYRDTLETIDALHSPVGVDVYTEASSLFADIASGR